MGKRIWGKETLLCLIKNKFTEKIFMKRGPKEDFSITEKKKNVEF